MERYLGFNFASMAILRLSGASASANCAWLSPAALARRSPSVRGEDWGPVSPYSHTDFYLCSTLNLNSNPTYLKHRLNVL